VHARLALALTLLGCAPAARPLPPYPPSRATDFKETLHGVELADPYRWLEDDESPETRAWIDAQNRYTHALLDGEPALPRIRTRLEALARVETQSAPFEAGGRYFVWRRTPKDELAILTVRDGATTEARVLLDPNPLSPDRTTQAGLESVSRDGRLIVYSIRRSGKDESELRVRDVASGADAADVMPEGLYRGVSLDGDARGFYYALQDRATGTRIRYHALGTPVSADTEVFGNGYGASVWVGVSVSENGRHLVFTVSHGWQRDDEIWVQDLPARGPPRPVVKDLGAHFEADYAGDRLIVQTNWQAPRGRIVEIDPAAPAPDRWREIVPERGDAIAGFHAVGGKLLVRTLHDVSARLELFSLEGKPLAEVELPGRGSVGAINGRWESGEVFLDFTSYTVPRATYRLDLATGKVAGWWRPQVPFDGQAYETEQVWYPSRDGTKIPMYVIHRKGLVRDGRTPALLSGYGGFGVALLPSFGSRYAWFLEAGGIVAVANLRGGSEFGAAWHKAGMLDKKQNVFDDFIAAGEHLARERYTSAERLAIAGGSNGGLLVGAALTQRPDLFRVVLCTFPDLDLVAYPRLKNNSPPALLEYGDARKPEEFAFIRTWSPYQNVRRDTRYPAVFLTTGDADTRVPPAQARKMTARLQAATTSSRPVVLLYDTKAGHAGGRSLTKVIDDTTMEMAFLARELGMTVR
jgi:prolyl oligopeptidase